MGSKIKIHRTPILAAMLVLMAATAAFAAETVLKEKAIPLKNVPEAVRETILREAGGHEVLEVELVKTTERKFYEAEWIEDGMEVEIQVARDGELLGRETEPLDDDADDARDPENTD